MWPFGLAAWLWGTVFIDRDNKTGAQNTVNKCSETINSKRVSLKSLIQKKKKMFPLESSSGTQDHADCILSFF